MQQMKQSFGEKILFFHNLPPSSEYLLAVNKHILKAYYAPPMHFDKHWGLENKKKWWSAISSLSALHKQNNGIKHGEKTIIIYYVPKPVLCVFMLSI